MSGILDKIFADKKVELDGVKRRLALPDIKIRISDKTHEIRNIEKALIISAKEHLQERVQPERILNYLQIQMNFLF